MRSYHAVYYSKMNGNDARDVNTILKEARRNNRDLGLTGALLVDGTHYLQVIEGPRDVLSLVMQRIMNDTRHHDVVIAAFCEIRERMFDTWSMGVVQLSAAQPLRLARHGLTLPLRPDDMSAREIWDVIYRVAQPSGEAEALIVTL